jgi:nucleoid DNA-binding protein
MTRSDIVDSLSEKLGTSKVEARRVLDAVLEEVAAAIRSGAVTLHGFGSFKIRDLPEREVINPRTGERSMAKPRRQAKFRPAPALLEVA